MRLTQRLNPHSSADHDRRFGLFRRGGDASTVPAPAAAPARDRGDADDSLRRDVACGDTLCCAVLLAILGGTAAMLCGVEPSLAALVAGVGAVAGVLFAAD